MSGSLVLCSYSGINRSESSGECTEPTFWCEPLSYEDVLTFVFHCRSEDWLQAEGFIRKRRRQRGEPEPAEDSEVEPLPKPEPVEEAVNTNDIPMGGGEVIFTAGSPSQPRSPTPLSYSDEKPVIQPGKKARSSTLRPTGQEQLRPSLSDFVILERPQKIPRHSGNFTITTDANKTQPMVIKTHSISKPHILEGGSGSKTKIEEGGSVPNVKAEEGSSVLKIKEEVGETTDNKFDELQVCASSA